MLARPWRGKLAPSGESRYGCLHVEIDSSAPPCDRDVPRRALLEQLVRNNTTERVEKPLVAGELSLPLLVIDAEKFTRFLSKRGGNGSAEP